MGYTTEFSGQFNVIPAMKESHRLYLEAFARTRRMKRKSDVAEGLRDPVRQQAKLPIGPDGGYFVGSPNDIGQNHDNSIVNYNGAPQGQPGLWCQWVPNDDGTAIVWDESEKFDAYVEWLEYLIANFLEPWGYKLNGTVLWRGEDFHDIGRINVSDNDVTSQLGDF